MGDRYANAEWAAPTEDDVTCGVAPAGRSCIVKNNSLSEVVQGTDMGDANADLSTEEDVARIRNVIASMGNADSGKFYKWNGDIHPW